jgi:hypothetical protein
MRELRCAPDTPNRIAEHFGGHQCGAGQARCALSPGSTFNPFFPKHFLEFPNKAGGD